MATAPFTQGSLYRTATRAVRYSVGKGLAPAEKISTN